MKEIDIENKFYPKLLRNIINPPKTLYLLGNENNLRKKSLSIIGSRNASDYGRKNARIFAKGIAMQGINIVSGMAEGIDSEAHLGAMEVEGSTIAVLGSGFNHIFPHRKVFEDILKHDGTIITEYEPDVEVFSDGFRKRNRIVAGISLGTLVIEAKAKSGTSITAGSARQFERKVFCIPHRMEDEYGKGTNRLLKNGGILVTSILDILRYYDISEIIDSADIEENIEVPKEYRECYERIGKNPISSNQISKLTNKSISEVNTVLTMLELEGFIKSLPGNYFCKKD